MTVTKFSYRKKISLQLRQNILFAAAQLFRKKGFRGTSLNDVANQVGTSKANIYNYLQNKDQILYEVLTSAISDAIKRACEIQGSSVAPKEKLENLVKLHVRIETSYNNPLGGIAAFERRSLPDNLRKKYDALRNEYEQVLRSVLEEAMSAGQIRHCDTKLVGRFILGLINSIPHWFKQTGPLSSEDIGNEIWQFIKSGIVQGRKINVKRKKISTSIRKL